ncbi:MAG TPA: glycosyltransferase family 2 protein [Rhizomicrobium sp.]|jgi:glycosyltransferase involved in cell wall biosynthesis|nr:glycosyltransferase family 2 protein [Rhizomicrobium sp.]
MRSPYATAGIPSAQQRASRDALWQRASVASALAVSAFSLIIIGLNEAANIEPLLLEVLAALQAIGGGAYEIIFVDDGSSDDSIAQLVRLREHIPFLRIFRHAEPLGQSAAIRTGVLAARHPIVVTMDGDGQNDPAEIARLLAPFSEAGSRVALVAGQRLGRQDSLSKRVASRVANHLRQSVLNDGARDTGCGLKAFRRDAYLALPYFDHMHRYLIALMRQQEQEVRFVDVVDRPRRAGRSKYGNIDRLLVGIPDLFGVWWLQHRQRGRAAVDEL